MTTEDTMQVPADVDVPPAETTLAETPPLPVDQSPPRWVRIMRNPLLRILIFIAMTVAFSLLVRWVTGTHRTGLRGMATASPLALCGQVLMASLPIILAYVLLVRAIEGRRIDELAWRKLLPHSALGLLAGAVCWDAAVRRGCPAHIRPHGALRGRRHGVRGS